MSHRISFQKLSAIAEFCGLELVGALSVADAEAVLKRHASYLAEWQSRGHAAEMGYMQRAPAMFETLSTVLPEAKSIICFAAPYSQDRVGEELEPPVGYGKVSRYAWGKDYHRVLVRRLRDLLEKVRLDELSGASLKARVFADAVPILERSLSQAAGLGFLGKNSMLITSKRGSFQFLCEIVWDVDIDFDSIAEGKPVAVPKSVGCGKCERCLTHCPTDALVSAAELNSARCISYLTIEYRGLFDQWQREAVGSWLFGCDECQNICPFNNGVQSGVGLPEFFKSEGPGPFLNVADLLEIRTHPEFTDRFAGTALMRTGRKGLIRNACAVTANMGMFNCIGGLRDCCILDADPLVRQSAKQALQDLLSIADGGDRRRLSRVLDELSRLSPESA